MGIPRVENPEMFAVKSCQPTLRKQPDKSVLVNRDLRHAILRQAIFTGNMPDRILPGLRAGHYDQTKDSNKHCQAVSHRQFVLNRFPGVESV